MFRYRAFTLIELLVTIAIIGLLATVVMSSLNSARKKARDARRLADLRELKKAVEMYYDDNGIYPCAGDPSATNFNSLFLNVDIAKNSCLATALIPDYIKVIPSDPLYGTDTSLGWGYQYTYHTKGDGYYIRTFLESNNYKQDHNYPHKTPEYTACDVSGFPKCNWYEDCGFYRGYGPFHCAFTYHVGNSD